MPKCAEKNIMSRFFQRFAEPIIKVVDVVSDEVREIPVLGVAPDELHRIQLRRVRRQPFKIVPGSSALQLPCCSPMCVEPIQDDHHAATELTPKRCQETTHVVVLHVFSMNLKVKAESSSLRRDRDRRNHRQAIMPSPAFQHWGLAPRSPGAPHQRLEHESALVHEDKGLTVPSWFFCKRSPGLTA